MGKIKKGKKVDLEKKAALQAKKDAKQGKAALKRLSKQHSQQKSGDDDDDDDNHDDGSFSEVATMDQILQAYKSQDKALQDKIDKPTLDTLTTEFPLPRANATLELGGDDKNKDFLFLFGGEYFDGIENVVLDELLRFDCRKKEWKQILTSPRPSPGCAHSCVAYKHYLFVFGGEMATADAYHHYRDLWKFDLNTLQWIEINAKNPPSPRSGHACFVWKNYMILFGGFFEAMRETKWYNDLHVFNLQTETWMDVPQSRLAMKPEPRSACNVAMYGQDKALVHGGFMKLKTSNASAESKVHTDAWMLHLAPILQQKAPTWERWISSTKTVNSNSPNGRAGTSCISYKNRMVVFGGVVDKEQLHHKVDSIFYNDLLAMDIDRRKWFPLRVKDKNASETRRLSNNKESSRDGKEKVGDQDLIQEETVKQDDEEEAESLSELQEDGDDNEANGKGDQNIGWDLDRLRSNMFAFIDGEGNIIYEKVDNDESKEDHSLEEVKEEEKEGDSDEEYKNTQRGEKEEEINKHKKTQRVRPAERYAVSTSSHEPKKITSSSVIVLNESTNAPEAVARSEPLPRINTTMVLRGHVMYLLGGILEVGDREITLDDMWSLDLRKREQWDCIWPGTMHRQVWRGAVHDDDDSYISTGKEDGPDDDDTDDDVEEEEEDEDGDEVGVASPKKSIELKRTVLRQEVAELNEKYGLSDENRTPGPGEALADFYSPTSEYWNSVAADGKSGLDTDVSRKELKRRGFVLAKERFDELEPVLSRLSELNVGERADKDSASKKRTKKAKNINIL